MNKTETLTSDNAIEASKANPKSAKIESISSITFKQINNMLICRTDKELEKALEAKAQKIIFEGPQASAIIRNMEEAEKKRRNAKITTGILGALCLLAVPFTGGGSLLALGATAGVAAISTEVALAIIAAIVTISTAAIEAMKEYNIRKLEHDRIELTRR